MKPTIARAEDILSNLDYEGGFSSRDINTQSEFGTYVNEESKSNFHTNAALPAGAGQEMDKTILRAIAAEPRMFGDLTKAGCKYSVPFGTYISRYTKQNLADSPVIAMDFDYQAKYSNALQTQADYSDVLVPIPLLFHKFSLSQRQIAAAANRTSFFGGMNLEQQEIYVKSLSLSSAIDTVIWNGTTAVNVDVGGGNNVPVYGILNQPQVVANEDSITLSLSEPAAFIEAVREQIQVLVNQKYEGKFVIYYSSNLEFALQTDYTGQFPLRTIEERIRQFSRVQDVRTTHFLDPAADPSSTTVGTMVIMKMDPQVIDIVTESEMRVAQYATNPEKVKYLLYAALAPRVKVDYYGRVGIQKVTINVTE